MRYDLAKSTAVLVAVIEMNVPEPVVARTSIGGFQSMALSNKATRLDERCQQQRLGLVGSFVNGVENH
jgi:hypothetical protein